MKIYWSGYAFYLYLKNKYRIRYIPRFHKFSKDKRRLLITKRSI
jgi:hypothetical protein